MGVETIFCTVEFLKKVKNMNSDVQPADNFQKSSFELVEV